MVEEFFVAGAEIIQAVLSRRRLREAMLGALAVTSKAHFALLAFRRKRRSFGSAEARLL